MELVINIEAARSGVVGGDRMVPAVVIKSIDGSDICDCSGPPTKTNFAVSSHPDLTVKTGRACSGLVAFKTDDLFPGSDRCLEPDGKGKGLRIGVLGGGIDVVAGAVEIESRINL